MYKYETPYSAASLASFLGQIKAGARQIDRDFEYDDVANARLAVLSFLGQLGPDGENAAKLYAEICDFKEGY